MTKLAWAGIAVSSASQTVAHAASRLDDLSENQPDFWAGAGSGMWLWDNLVLISLFGLVVYGIIFSNEWRKILLTYGAGLMAVYLAVKIFI